MSSFLHIPAIKLVDICMHEFYLIKKVELWLSQTSILPKKKN